MTAVEQKNGYTIRMRKGAAAISAREDARPPQAQQIGSPYGLFATPRNSGQSDFYRPRLWTGIGSRELVNQYDWLELLMFSRQLVAQRGNLGAAVVQKNLYAVGDAWKPHYMGDNPEWGKDAERWLRDVWYPNCDVRGGVFDFVTNLFLSGVAYDVDGDDLCIFAVDEEGFPKLKFVPADCIGNRSYRSEVKGGPYDGAKICNGMVIDRDQRVLAVNVLGLDPTDDELVPAYNCQLLYEPEWRSTSRGIPRVGKSCLDWFDVEDIDTFLKRGVKLDASRPLMHYTESGEAPTAHDIIVGRVPSTDTTTKAQDIKAEYIAGGEILYMRAGKGEKLEAFKSERPHSNTEAFIQRLERRGFLGIGWFYELTDPSGIGGAPTRQIQDQARHQVACRQKTLKARARRGAGFAISQAMRSGMLPENYKGDDFLKWGFNMPAQLTVDAGYDEQADRENLKIGTTTMAAVCEKRGGWWEDFRGQTKKENFNLIDSAAELVKYAKDKYNWDLKPEQALDMTRQFGANERRPNDNSTGGNGGNGGQA